MQAMKRPGGLDRYRGNTDSMWREGCCKGSSHAEERKGWAKEVVPGCNEGMEETGVTVEDTKDGEKVKEEDPVWRPVKE